MGRPKNRRKPPSKQRRSRLLGLSVTEFCREENVSRSTFYEWMKRGLAPALLQPRGPGGWSRITPEAVAAWRARFASSSPVEAAE
jgi:hypothetical protein